MTGFEWRKRRCRIIPVVVAATTVALSNGFVLHSASCSPHRTRHDRQHGFGAPPRRTQCYAASSSNDERNPTSSSNAGREFRRRQEADLEAMSVRGASKIARMGIPERTKRALLAEAVENRIFALQQELLELAQSHGKYSVAKTLAQQIKLAQGQYEELVNGDPSDMLRAYDSLASMSNEDIEADDDEEEEEDE